MGRASLTQHGFNAGELSALLLGRQDLDKYASGMYVCLNAVARTQGAWTRRPGTAYLHEVKFSNKATRILPFQYSTTQTYVLEFGESYIRFFTGHGIVTKTTQAITGATAANPVVVTYSGSDTYANGERVYISGVVGMTQLNNREFIVSNVDTGANTFELQEYIAGTPTNVNGTGYDAYTSGGTIGEILEVTTAFTESELADIRITQSADTLYILHPDYPPQQLVRVSALSWTLSDIEFTDGPYDNLNTTTTTLSPSAAVDSAPTNVTGAVDNGSGLIRITSATHGLTTGDAVLVADVGGTTEANGYWEVTVINANEVDLQGSAFVNTYTSGGTIKKLVKVTASSTTGINSDTGFQATDVGRLVRMKESTTWGYGEIEFVDSTTVAWVDVLSTLTNTNAKVNWRLGVWSDTTGFPAVGTFYEDRLFLAGAATYPQRLDGSKTSNYTNFSPSATDGTVADDNGVAIVLNSDDVNAVRWMLGTDKGMAVGTTGNEWQVRAGSLTDPITPTNAKAYPSSKFGSYDTGAVKPGKAVIYIQRGGRKVRELAYVFEDDGFRSPDMTILSEHITRPAITELAFQGQPQPTVWGVRSDGVLLGLSYEREQGVVAWHRHELGGQSDAAGDTIPVVESIAAVTAPDGTRDELYLIVKRYINGRTRRYIEYLTKVWEVEDNQEDSFHVDCGWSQVDVSPTTAMTGLFHLEGEEVGIYVDGAIHPAGTVTNGKLTLNTAGTIKTIGYYYNSDGQTMPIEGGAADGSAQGKIKRISRVGFWLVDTLGLKYGKDFSNLTELLVRDFSVSFGVVTPLFTGVSRRRFEGDYDKLGQACWRCDGPFPGTVVAFMPQINVSDDS